VFIFEYRQRFECSNGSMSAMKRALERLNQLKREGLAMRQKKNSVVVLVAFFGMPAFAAEKPTQFVFEPEESFFSLSSKSERILNRQ